MVDGMSRYTVYNPPARGQPTKDTYLMTDETTERLVNTVLDLMQEVLNLKSQLLDTNMYLESAYSAMDDLQTDICNWSDKLSDKSLATELKTLVSDR